MMENLQKLPPVKWSMDHPRLAGWIVLSLGMVALLVNEARDVGLTTGNWIALIVATVLVAGACIFIVGWEDVDESGPIDKPLTEPDAEKGKAESAGDEANSGGADSSVDSQPS